MKNTYLDNIRPSQISIVIPVKDNQLGIDKLLSTFFLTQQVKNYPLEIIIVDNNSSISTFVQDQFNGFEVKIHLLHCSKLGPAAARNVGANFASGEWLLFVDSDCIPTESMIEGYLCEENTAIAFQGCIGALGSDYVSKYYESQQIHRPPSIQDENGNIIPKYLVTANIMVKKSAFESIGGFNESYSFAGEDIDFGSRLSSGGNLAYAPESKVLHNFDDGFWGLVIRFIKYGKGNRLVQKKLKIPLYPLPFTAKNKRVWVNHLLAIVQWLCLLLGFTLKSIKLLTDKTPRKET